jgi:hypothetical protein
MDNFNLREHEHNHTAPLQTKTQLDQGWKKECMGIIN